MNLSKLTGPELVSQYNSAAVVLGEQAIKKFATKKDALRRTTIMMARAIKPESTPEPEKAKPAKEPKPRRMRFVYPYNGDDHFRGIQREKSLRGRAAEVLLKGATFEEIIAVVSKFDEDRGSTPGHVERRAYEVVRLLHYYTGYGLREEGDKIFIHKNVPGA